MSTHNEHADHKHHDHDDHSEHHNHHDDHGGHDHHHHHGDFEKIFKNSLWIGIPILLLSPFMGLFETGLISFS